MDSFPLLHHELFSGLETADLHKLATRLHKQNIPAGTIVFNEGDEADCLYIIESGSIEIYLESSNAETTVLSTLNSGAFFGEMGILCNSRRTASAKSINPAVLWVLPRKDFNELITQIPELSLALSRVLSNRLALTNQLLRDQKTKKASPSDMKRLPTALFDAFRDKMKPHHIDAQGVIFEAGDMGEELFLIEDGDVAITVKNSDGETLTLAKLKKGDYFGEMALLTDSPRTASAHALSKTKLLGLSKSDFQTLLENHHVIALELSKVLSQRLTSTNKMLSHKDDQIIITCAGDDKATPRIQSFYEYISTLTQKSVVMLAEPSPKELSAALQNDAIRFLLIRVNKITAELMDLDDFTLSFSKKADGAWHLSADESELKWQALARRIAKKRVGIALSSGTAPGLAHIGVMKALIEANIPIDFIAGTSGGSLYGSAFAFDRSYEDIYQTFSKVYKKSLIKLWDPAFRRSGIFDGKKLLNRTIKRLLGNPSIENATIPYAAVATDIVSGKEVIQKSGPLLPAIRASLSIPILFTPVKNNDKLLVDGVVTTPVPISALEEAEMDIKIAVYVSELTPFEKPKPNLMSVFLRARNIAADFIADESVERADVVIKPDTKDIKQFDYNRIDSIVASGYEAAQKVIPRIKRLLAQ